MELLLDPVPVLAAKRRPFGLERGELAFCLLTLLLQGPQLGGHCLPIPELKLLLLDPLLAVKQFTAHHVQLACFLLPLLLELLQRHSG